MLAGCNSTQRTNDSSWIAAHWANVERQFKEIVIRSERSLRSERIWAGRAENRTFGPLPYPMGLLKNANLNSATRLYDP